MSSFSDMIQEIIEEVIEEMSTTGNISGYETPNAFSDKKKLKKDAIEAFGFEIQDNEEE